MNDAINAIIIAGEDHLKLTNELYVPYEKQRQFHMLGKSKRERLLSAGNQMGKSEAGAAECVMHSTGIYPDYWPGRRYNRPVDIWVGGVTPELMRNSVIKKIVGGKNNVGRGMLHIDYIEDINFANNVCDGFVDFLRVRNVNGGTSTIQFHSYKKGVEKWQAASVDIIWMDEEPPEDIYFEALARLTATNGMLYTTFTPLKGMSRVAYRYFKQPSADRDMVLMGIEDALHIPEERRQSIIDGYPEHERRARIQGLPVLGSGAVFPVLKEDIMASVPEIPDHWPRIVGLDFGWDHPTAAAWITWDRDTDTVYVYDIYRQSQQDILYHAAAIKSRGDWIPVAWPHDGLQHDKGSGQTLAEQYEREGVFMLDDRATFEDGGHGVEAGISEMLTRMKTGRLKIAPHLQEFWEEFELYHRKNGKLVKERDDVISAVRYGIMMMRFAISATEAENMDDYYGEDDYAQEDRSEYTGY